MTRNSVVDKSDDHEGRNERGEDSEGSEDDDHDDDHDDEEDDGKYDDICECVNVLQKDALLSPVEIINILAKVVDAAHIHTYIRTLIHTYIHTYI